MERMALAGIEPLPKVINNDTPAAERQKLYLEGRIGIGMDGWMEGDRRTQTDRRSEGQEDIHLDGWMDSLWGEEE